jgi:hypothetical protein
MEYLLDRAIFVKHTLKVKKANCMQHSIMIISTFILLNDGRWYVWIFRKTRFRRWGLLFESGGVPGVHRKIPSEKRPLLPKWVLTLSIWLQQ